MNPVSASQLSLAAHTPPLARAHVPTEQSFDETHSEPVPDGAVTLPAVVEYVVLALVLAVAFTTTSSSHKSWSLMHDGVHMPTILQNAYGRDASSGLRIKLGVILAHAAI